MVPKFIEEEMKIIGPLTFKQFLYIGGAVGICFLFHFLLPLPLFLFIPIAVTLIGGAFALAFLKIEDHSLPEILKNFFFFSISSKIYLWKKTIMPPKIIRIEKKEEKEKKKGKKKETQLKIGGKSHLTKLASRLEIKESQ